MLKPSAQRVQDVLHDRGFTNQVIELTDSARTAAEAATAMGCESARLPSRSFRQNRVARRS